MDEDLLGPLRRLLEGRYRIDRELGRGGFATVYQVWNPRLERAEALKVLAPGHQADEDFPKRFAQEVRLAASLEHPSIAKVYDFGEGGGTFWYSMQLVDGRTLAGELRAGGPLRERAAARIAIPLLDALEYSHARGIVHRDIKPENVLLDREGHPFLMDFGVAKSAGSLVKTQTGFLLGMPAYVAPEQAQGKPIDGRADLYALGVTLYRVVSGAYPFEAEDPLQAVVLRLTHPPRPLREARPGVDPAFEAIVMRALERRPALRWESARAMRDAFAAYLEGRTPDTTGTRVLGLEEIPADTPAEGAADPAPEATAVPTLVRPVPGSVVPSAGARSKRPGSPLLPILAAFVVLFLSLGGTAIVLYGPGSKRSETPARPAAPLPEPTRAVAPATAAPLPSPEAPPTPAPAPAETATARPSRPPEPAPPAARRPVTVPERLTPEPPLAGPQPAECSGQAVAASFAVDADGNVVAPRLLPSEAPAACGRLVLEALPRWKWKPSVDAAGTPVLSARLVVSIQLP